MNTRLMKDNLYFRLFADCIPVKGAQRSVICDLQRRRVDFIPNSLFDLLEEEKGKSIKEIKEIYGPENENVIEEYFQFLINKEYLFFCTKDELDLFPELSMDWEVPNLIENAVIDSGKESKHDFRTIFAQLANLGCMAIHLRFFFAPSFEYLKSILDLLKKSRIESVEVLLGFSPDFGIEQLHELAEEHPRLTQLQFHTASPDSPLEFHHDLLSVSWITKAIDSCSHCGQISRHFFVVNRDTFIESVNHNSCLNHKIAIDQKGQIKNCPSLPQSFGHISKTSLAAALQAKGFKKLWDISKDQIEGCKDCEFRHICTDCRAYIEEPENNLSKPLKCGYDPYTCEWSEWSKNPLKEKAVEHYNLRETLKSEKRAAI